ncbi:MAG: carboxylating nicotinate-nucleotide diphosphorylase [Actinomycetota bacterium]
MEPDRSTVERLVDSWLSEDLGRGDVTSRAIAGGRFVMARIEARAPMVVAGIDIARACFERLGPIRFEALVKDSQHVDAIAALARLEGPLETVLGAERTALNVLGHLSGIATLTAQFVTAVAGTGVRIADTRKTTPGLRVVEKYAVSVGGGTNQRFGLDEDILIKENHVAAAGGVTKAIERARANAPFGLRIEVEVTSESELSAALDAGAEIVLLDNMSPDRVRDSVAHISGRALVEVSGGITLTNVRDYALPGVDLISVGALTHSAPTADVALEVER